MPENEIVWPMGMTDRNLSDRPMVFNPQGFLVAILTDDQATIALYFGHAREGRSALWIQVDDDAEANRAIRGLADFDTLHIRHYGHRSQTDFHLRRRMS